MERKIKHYEQLVDLDVPKIKAGSIWNKTPHGNYVHQTNHLYTYQDGNVVKNCPAVFKPIYEEPKLEDFPKKTIKEFILEYNSTNVFFGEFLVETYPNGVIILPNE